MISDMAAAASSVVMSSRRRRFSINAGKMSCTHSQPQRTQSSQSQNISVFSANSAVNCRLHLASVQSIFQKIPQDAPAFARHDRFGMKLHAVDGPRAMAKTHDDAFFAGPC